MAAHVRIRILLVLMAAVICGGVYAVTEVQRRDAESSFEEYSAVRELRGVTTQAALAFDEAAAGKPGFRKEVEASEQAMIRASDTVRSRVRQHRPADRSNLRLQLVAATELAELADEAADGRPTAKLEQRRDELLARFMSANDRFLTRLAEERSEERRAGVLRPVVLVVALFLLFGVLHLSLVERPASRARRRRAAQAEFGDAMQVARSESEAYDVLSRHVGASTDAVQVTVLSRNNSKDRLEAVTPARTGSAVALGLDGAAPDSCLAVRLTRTQQRKPGEERLLRCELCGKSEEQTTCVPSLVGGEVIGAVLVEHHGPLTAEERQDIEHSVAEAAPVVANLRNLAVAEVRASTDALTGLANRRAAEETLKREAANAARTVAPLALLTFDLDHFKTINDTYGHGKGDEVLAAVGAAAADSLRALDFVGRIGGEEFVAILPGTDRAGAVTAAETLRAAISSVTVPGIDRRITASFGVAVLPDDAEEPDLLLRAADRALYSAKRAGRDRVETAEERLPGSDDEELAAILSSTAP